MKARNTLRAGVASGFALATALGLGGSAYAASHREAPMIANDPTADITDVYAFRSWERPDNVVFMMNVIPGQEPSSGPNYFTFDPKVAYDIHIDTNRDGDADDIVYRVQFKTEFRGVAQALALPVPYAAVPPITELDGPGSEGLGIRQRYSVTEYRGKRVRELGQQTMFALPSNIGPATTPNFDQLRDKGIFPLKNGGHVYAGPGDETFYIDLGATFDTVNLRRKPPLLTAQEDADDTTNPFGNDAFSGFNVNTIAIEVPIKDILGAGWQNANVKTIGMYASTSRPELVKLVGNGRVKRSRSMVQVARMANPLVNELIIGTGQKDFWNAVDPVKEAKFLDFYLNSRLATVLNLVYNLPSLGLGIPETGRTDLVNALLKYSHQPQTGSCSRSSPCSELLRLDLGVPPTASENQKRLTVLAGDPAGWPNGRRPNDDVTDLALRVVAGVLVSPQPASGGLLLGDGVNFNIGAPGPNLTANGIYKKFPFLPTPHDGRNRRHIDCDEAGANPCN